MVTSDQQAQGNETLKVRFGVSLTGQVDWTPFLCPIEPPAPEKRTTSLSRCSPKFQRNAELPADTSSLSLSSSLSLQSIAPESLDERERRRLAVLAAALRELRRGDIPPRGGVGPHGEREQRWGSSHGIVTRGQGLLIPENATVRLLLCLYV